MEEPVPALAPAIPDDAIVQLNDVEGTSLEREMDVIPPEKTACEDGFATTPGLGLTVTFKEALVDELLHPKALTVTVAGPEKALFQVTTPALVMLPAPGVILQV